MSAMTLFGVWCIEPAQADLVFSLSPKATVSALFVIAEDGRHSGARKPGHFTRKLVRWLRTEVNIITRSPDFAARAPFMVAGLSQQWANYISVKVTILMIACLLGMPAPEYTYDWEKIQVWPKPVLYRVNLVML